MLFVRTTSLPCLGVKSALARIAVVAALLGGSFTAALAESPATYMQRVANELVAASRTGSASSFAATIRRHADVPGIGLTALGSHAASLPKPERPTYYNGMVNFISRYAAKEAPKYPVAKAVVIGQSEETAKGAIVDSKVTLQSGETYDVRWSPIRQGQSFKVRDAEVVGFWMTPFLNSLFQNYIAENGGSPRALVAALNK
jgi:phospholipid transport system substrate-binding protein